MVRRAVFAAPWLFQRFRLGRMLSKLVNQSICCEYIYGQIRKLNIALILPINIRLAGESMRVPSTHRARGTPDGREGMVVLRANVASS